MTHVEFSPAEKALLAEIRRCGGALRDALERGKKVRPQAAEHFEVAIQRVVDGVMVALLAMHHDTKDSETE